jgi:hypothetical protein
MKVEHHLVTIAFAIAHLVFAVANLKMNFEGGILGTLAVSVCAAMIANRLEKRREQRVV